MVVSCGLRNNATPIFVTTLTQVSPLANTPQTVTLSATEQPVQPPLLTPIPTLRPEEALETFADLIEKNDECDLPCWLGIIPGQTDSGEVVNKFSEFSAIANTNYSSEWASTRIFLPNFEAATHDIATNVAFAENGKVAQILVAASSYLDKNGPLDYNNPEFQRLLQRYFVPGIFMDYGQPENIFLDTTLIAADPAISFPYVIWVIYPQKGFLIRYQGNNIRVGNNISICPMQSRIEIRIWDVTRSVYEEFIKDDRALGISTSLGPQPIESVTDFDIGSFYEAYSSGRSDTCFETPASIWPQ
jgi:hypothetical protein